MTASPITVRPVHRPAYDNSRTDWQAWYARNETRLVEYYAALALYTERPAEEDFLEFAMCQFDVAMLSVQFEPDVCSLLKRQAG